MAIWIDSHCHLDSVEGPEDAIERALETGIAHMVTVGTDISTSLAAVELASRHEQLSAVVGIHPHDAKFFSDESRRRLGEIASAPQVVGIGETGLDYYRDLSPRPAQQEAFREHIALAKEHGLALVIHMRDAHDDVYRIIAGEGAPPRVVFHCFSGDGDQARRALDLGGYLSFAGNITYPKTGDLRNAAGVVPLDRLLVETDSPYLAPVPHRGKRNEPAYVNEVGRALAEIIGRPEEAVAEATSANAREVFAL